jgi:hypothetical protein
MSNSRPASQVDVAKLIRDFSNALSQAKPALGACERVLAGTELAGAKPQDTDRAPDNRRPPCARSTGELNDIQIAILPTHDSQGFDPRYDEPETDLDSDEIIERFCTDQETLDHLGVSDSEREALREVRLCGTLTCQRDVLHILQSIRRSSQLTPQLESSQSLVTDAHRGYFSPVADQIRRAALARLEEDANTKNSARRAISRFIGAIKAAVLAPAAAMRDCVTNLRWSYRCHVIRKQAAARPLSIQLR